MYLKFKAGMLLLHLHEPKTLVNPKDEQLRSYKINFVVK